MCVQIVVKTKLLNVSPLIWFLLSVAEINTESVWGVWELLLSEYTLQHSATMPVFPVCPSTHWEKHAGRKSFTERLRSGIKVYAVRIMYYQNHALSASRTC